MTTGIDPEPPAWRQRWAAEQLGVSPEASPAEVHATLLRRLPEVGFVPPPAWRQALRILNRRDVGTAGVEEAALAEEERLREEVEEFADSFWSLAPPQRRECWAELSGHCAEFPPLRARLRQLQPALDLDPAPPDKEEPLVAELAGQVQFLFSLRPLDRAAAWRALLQRIEGQMGAWEMAARRLKKRQRALAALEPDRVNELASWSSRQRHLARSRRRLRWWPNQVTMNKRNLVAAVLIWIVIILIFVILLSFSGDSRQTETQGPIPPLAPTFSPREPINWPGQPPSAPEAKDKATDKAPPSQQQGFPHGKGGPTDSSGRAGKQSP